MKPVIFTTVINSPDFILLQRALLTKLCEHPFRFVVVNDCKPVGDNTNGFDDRCWRNIEDSCRQEGIEYVRLPQDLHERRSSVFPRASIEASASPADSPADRCAVAVQWALNEVGFRSSGAVMILDADMFPIREFSLTEMLEGKEIAGVWQERRGGFPWYRRIRYLWNGLLVVDVGALPDKPNFSMECGRVSNVPTDVGGHLHHYFTRNPGVRVRPIRHYSSGQWGRQEEPEWLPDAVRGFLRSDVKNVEGRYYAEIYDDRFFHFRAGGNWDGMDGAKFKARQMEIIEALNRLI